MFSLDKMLCSLKKPELLEVLGDLIGSFVSIVDGVRSVVHRW